MKLWIDAIRPAPDGYIWLKSTQSAISWIQKYSNYLDWDMNRVDCIELLDLDHDDGILDWLEENHLSYPIRIHSN